MSTKITPGSTPPYLQLDDSGSDTDEYSTGSESELLHRDPSSLRPARNDNSPLNLDFEEYNPSTPAAVNNTASIVDNFVTSYMDATTRSPLAMDYLKATGAAEKELILQEFKNTHHLTKKEVKQEIKKAIHHLATSANPDDLALSKKGNKLFEKNFFSWHGSEFSKFYKATHGLIPKDCLTTKAYILAGLFFALAGACIAIGIAGAAFDGGISLIIGLSLAGFLITAGTAHLGLDWMEGKPEQAMRQEGIDQFETNIALLKDANNRIPALQTGITGKEQTIQAEKAALLPDATDDEKAAMQDKEDDLKAKKIELQKLIDEIAKHAKENTLKGEVEADIDAAVEEKNMKKRESRKTDIKALDGKLQSLESYFGVTTNSGQPPQTPVQNTSTSSSTPPISSGPNTAASSSIPPISSGPNTVAQSSQTRAQSPPTAKSELTPTIRSYVTGINSYLVHNVTKLNVAKKSALETFRNSLLKSATDGSSSSSGATSNLDPKKVEKFLEKQTVNSLIIKIEDAADKLYAEKRKRKDNNPIDFSWLDYAKKPIDQTDKEWLKALERKIDALSGRPDEDEDEDSNNLLEFPPFPRGDYISYPNSPTDDVSNTPWH